MRLRAALFQFAKETKDLRATEQIVTGARMNLPRANLVRRQIPHLEVAEGFRPRILPQRFRDRAEKLHRPGLRPHPAGMIHVRGKSPFRRAPAAAIMGDHISKSIPLEFHVRAFAQLRLDLRPHRFFVKRGGRLPGQGRDHREHFLFAHQA